MRRKPCTVAILLASVLASSAFAQEKKRSLLVIGQSKGYQHESISTAMVTLYNLGHSSEEVGHRLPHRLHRHHQEAAQVRSQESRLPSTRWFFSPTALWIWMNRKRQICCHSSSATARASSAFTARPSRSSPGPNTARCSVATSTAIPGASSMRRWLSRMPRFPGMSHLPKRLTLKDEIYQIKDFSRANVRVLTEPRPEQARSVEERRPS